MVVEEDPELLCLCERFSLWTVVWKGEWCSNFLFYATTIKTKLSPFEKDQIMETVVGRMAVVFRSSDSHQEKGGGFYSG